MNQEKEERTTVCTSCMLFYRNTTNNLQMKKFITILTMCFFFNIVFSQKTIISGEYNDGLKLAYDSKSNKITGYFEMYTGSDEETKNSQFSCVFYIEGFVDGKKNKIKTYYPKDKIKDIILGNLEITNNKTVTIKLPEEHDGCWNVEHFADEPVEFQLQKSANWVQIRYIDSSKSNFYNEKANDKKLKSYLVKGNIVCVEKIEAEWAFCNYFGKKVTKGWIKLSDLNKL
jgi:hypothetical protein